MSDTHTAKDSKGGTVSGTVTQRDIFGTPTKIESKGGTHTRNFDGSFRQEK